MHICFSRARTISDISYHLDILLLLNCTEPVILRHVIYRSRHSPTFILHSEVRMVAWDKLWSRSLPEAFLRLLSQPCDTGGKTKADRPVHASPPLCQWLGYSVRK